MQQKPDPSPRWLLLVHQIPAHPSKVRVKTWRRLQGVGAVAIKNSVYVLPDSAEAREDFEWIRGEIVALGGEAIVFAADAVDELSTAEVIDAFAAARRGDWDALRGRAAELAVEHRERGPLDAAGRERLAREVGVLRGRAAQIEKIDHFGAAGRDEALAALADLERLARPAGEGPGEPAPRLRGADFRGRAWLTRPRPGVDRMASAWLIRRFIDPAAEFRFAERIPPGGDVVPFDMFGVELGHRGGRCTFETLVAEFGLADPALERLGRIVHELDLRTATITDPETSTVGRLVDGLRAAEADDARLLAHGMTLFEALYRSFR